MGAIFVRGEGGRSFLRLAKSVTRFEKVASSFEKRATTCTEHVMFESLLSRRMRLLMKSHSAMTFSPLHEPTSHARSA